MIFQSKSVLYLTLNPPPVILYTYYYIFNNIIAQLNHSTLSLLQMLRKSLTNNSRGIFVRHKKLNSTKLTVLQLLNFTLKSTFFNFIGKIFNKRKPLKMNEFRCVEIKRAYNESTTFLSPSYIFCCPVE